MEKQMFIFIRCSIILFLPIVPIRRFVSSNSRESGAPANISETSYEKILKYAAEKYRTAVLLTEGDKGAYYQRGGAQYYQPVIKTNIVDTTGAGDTFCGYFLAGLSEGMEPGESLKMAAAAAAITVSRPGASKSIPWKTEIMV